MSWLAWSAAGITAVAIVLLLMCAVGRAFDIRWDDAERDE
jgi:hypothetical protein